MFDCKRKRLTKWRGALVLMVALLAVSGCSSNNGNASSAKHDDVLTMKKSKKGRTQITILTKYAFTVNSFEQAVEEKFPDIDIVQVGNYTANTVLAKEYEKRIAEDDLTDVVMTWPLDVGKEYWQDRLMDLSGMSFTGNYKTSMLNEIAQNGKLYYLPGPATIRGIVYNKTLFEEHGWKVPTSYEEFKTLCQTIESTTDMRGLQLSIGNPEVLDTAFIGFNYGNSFSTPKDAQWRADYDKGKGSFIDQFGSALDVFQDLIDSNILQPEDLNVYYQDVQSGLAERKVVMIEDAVSMAHQASEKSSYDDEFALMPFFVPGTENDWARLYMTCYIGLNKHLQDKGNEDKYDKVMKLMDYISSSEGQEALMKDNEGSFSSVKGVNTPSIPELADMRNALDHGRYAVFPAPANQSALSAIREGWAGMVKGTMSKEEMAEMADKVNLEKDKSVKPKVLGKATSDFTMVDTGNYVTDLMKKAAKSDFALFLDNGKDGLNNGKGISAKFYEGNITAEDVNRVFPDLKHGEIGTLWKIKITGADLIKALEYTLPVDKIEGWFYYFSGLKLEFNPYAKPGSRISNLTTADGKKIDKKKVYTVAVMDETVRDEYIQSTKDTKIKIKDLITNGIKKDKEISPADDERMIVKK